MWRFKDPISILDSVSLMGTKTCTFGFLLVFAAHNMFKESIEIELRLLAVPDIWEFVEIYQDWPKGR